MSRKKSEITHGQAPRFVHLGVWCTALGLPAAVGLLVHLNLFRFANYSDREFIVQFVENGEQFSRWLMSIKITGWLFDLMGCPFFKASFPDWTRQAEPFTRVLNSLVMGAALVSCWLNRKTLFWPIFFAATGGAWLYLGFGFLKIYTWSAAATLLTLHWMWTELDEETTAFEAAAIAALLTSTYIGLAPLAVAVLGAYGLITPRKLINACAISLFLFYVLVRIFWDTPIQTYFDTLWVDVAFGEARTMYQPYVGKSAGENAFSIAPEFLYSAKHISDKVQMLVFGGVVVPLYFCIVIAAARFGALRHAAGSAWRRSRERGRADPRLAVGATLTVFGIYHLRHIFIYLPKIGPRMDIGLTYSLAVLFAYTLGLLYHSFEASSENVLWRRSVLVGHLVYSVFVWYVISFDMMPSI